MLVKDYILNAHNKETLTNFPKKVDNHYGNVVHACNNPISRYYRCYYNEYLHILLIPKWFIAKAPYFIHQSTIRPNITCSGVLLVVQSL